MSELAAKIRSLKDLPGTVPEAAELLELAAAGAPTGPVPMADPDAYLLAAADQWKTVGWRCACGATPDPSAADWRWNGTAWEHHHGGQAGHFRAEYTPAAEGERLRAELDKESEAVIRALGEARAAEEVLAETRAEVERLRATCERIAEHGGRLTANRDGTITGTGAWCAKQAKEALAQP